MQKKMADAGQYRWGGTWVNEKELKKLQEQEKAVNDQIAQMKQDFDAVQTRIGQLDGQIAQVANQMAVIDAGTYMNGGNGQVFRLPYPPIYFTLSVQLGALKNGRGTGGGSRSPAQGRQDRPEAVADAEIFGDSEVDRRRRHAPARRACIRRRRPSGPRRRLWFRWRLRHSRRRPNHRRPSPRRRAVPPWFAPGVSINGQYSEDWDFPLAASQVAVARRIREGQKAVPAATAPQVQRETIERQSYDHARLGDPDFSGVLMDAGEFCVAQASRLCLSRRNIRRERLCSSYFSSSMRTPSNRETPFTRLSTRSTDAPTQGLGGEALDAGWFIRTPEIDISGWTPISRVVSPDVAICFNS